MTEAGAVFGERNLEDAIRGCAEACCRTFAEAGEGEPSPDYCLRSCLSVYVPLHAQDFPEPGRRIMAIPNWLDKLTRYWKDTRGVICE